MNTFYRNQNLCIDIKISAWIIEFTCCTWTRHEDNSLSTYSLLLNNFYWLNIIFRYQYSQCKTMAYKSSSTLWIPYFGRFAWTFRASCHGVVHNSFFIVSFPSLLVPLPRCLFCPPLLYVLDWGASFWDEWKSRSLKRECLNSPVSPRREANEWRRGGGEERKEGIWVGKKENYVGHQTWFSSSVNCCLTVIVKNLKRWMLVVQFEQFIPNDSRRGGCISSPYFRLSNLIGL